MKMDKDITWAIVIIVVVAIIVTTFFILYHYHPNDKIYLTVAVIALIFLIVSVLWLTARLINYSSDERRERADRERSNFLRWGRGMNAGQMADKYDEYVRWSALQNSGPPPL